MSCSSCYKKYGLFLRETGCAKCGFSFCGKCCKYELTGLKKKVCLGCLNKSKVPVEKPSPVTPSVSETVTSPLSQPPITPLGPNEDDIKLQQRLEELQKMEPGASTSQTVTDLDLKQRLAKLQDRPFVEDNPNRDIFHIDQRSDQEKVNDLLEQVNNEAALNLASDPVKDLEERLNKLRGTEAKPSSTGNGNSSSVPLPDEEDDDKRYVKKIIAEAMLDAQLNFTDEERELMEQIPKPPKDAGDLDELPWCTICNEDAKLRCEDCSGELYCRSCFHLIHHDDEDYRSHRTKPYQKPKTEDDLSSSGSSDDD